MTFAPFLTSLALEIEGKLFNILILLQAWSGSHKSATFRMNEMKHQEGKAG